MKSFHTTRFFVALATTSLSLLVVTTVQAQQLDLGQTTAAPGFATVQPGTQVVTPGVATFPPQTVATAATVATLPPQTVATVPATTNPVTPAATTQAPVEDGWTGCIHPGLSEEDNLVRIDKPTTICIVLGSSTEWNVLSPPVHYLRLSFRPQADQYSRFHVPSSYQDLISQRAIPEIHNGNNNVTIHVASQKVLSFQRIFYSPNSGAGKVYPYLTAIIDVQKGVVKGITWDDACLFCSDDKCEENTYDFNGNLGTQAQYGQPTRGCYIPQAECTTAMVVSAGSDEAKPICDVSVYFVWTGTDADDKALQSSAFRFSAFPEQEIKNRITDNLPDIPLGSMNFFGGGDETTNAEANGQ